MGQEVIQVSWFLSVVGSERTFILYAMNREIFFLTTKF
jgi:hypothetical protein